jgi:hypothetical protein
MPAQLVAAEERPKLSSSAAGARRVEHDDGRHDDTRLPPDLPSDVCRHPCLHIERAEQVLAIHDQRLELGDEECPIDVLKAQEIDSAPVSVAVEADLGPQGPAPRFQPAHEASAQRRVVGIEKPIDDLALPADCPT